MNMVKMLGWVCLEPPTTQILLSQVPCQIHLSSGNTDAELAENPRDGWQIACTDVSLGEREEEVHGEVTSST